MSTYKEYIVEAAETATTFGSDCLNIAADFAASVPEYAAQTAAASSEYVKKSAAAVATMTNQASYEAFNRVEVVASTFAETLENTAASYPYWIDQLQNAASIYSTRAIYAALNFLNNAAAGLSPLEWMQKQDDGVYTSGKGGTSGGAGASGEWGVPEVPKYPIGGPPVPPQIIPGEKDRTGKLGPPQNTHPKGCVNKREPTIGEIYAVILAQMPGPLTYDVYWFDNICYRTQTKRYDQPAIEKERYAGTPCGIPKFSEIALFANIPKGRYIIESVTQNIIGYMMTNQQFYDTVEGWYWKGERTYNPVNIYAHEDAYHECLAIEYQNFSGSYFYKYGYPYNEEGSGHATHYTVGRARIVFLGDGYPDVEADKIPFAAAVSSGIMSQCMFRHIGLQEDIWRRLRNT